MGQLSVCPLLPGTGLVLFLLRTKLISGSLSTDKEGQARPWLPPLPAESTCGLLGRPVAALLRLLLAAQLSGPRAPTQGPKGFRQREMEYCYGGGSHETLEVLFRPRCDTTLQDPETRCVWLRDILSHSYEASASFGPFSRN